MPVGNVFIEAVNVTAKAKTFVTDNIPFAGAITTRDVVLLNAAPAIVAGGAAKTWKEGIELAAESIDSGAALIKLEELRAFL